MSGAQKRLPIVRHSARWQRPGLGVNLHIGVRRRPRRFHRGESLKAGRSRICEYSGLPLWYRPLRSRDFAREPQSNAQNTDDKVTQVALGRHSLLVKSGVAEDDVLPSINELSFEYEISRDTAEKGYKQLKKMGLLSSVPGKGYFIRSTEIDQTLRVFLLFNKLSAHKKIIYDSLVGALSDKAFFDFYIYNNDFSLFKKLLLNRKQEYTHYVIIPHFIDGGEKAFEVINTIDKDKLIILDKLVPGVTGDTRLPMRILRRTSTRRLNRHWSAFRSTARSGSCFPKTRITPGKYSMALRSSAPSTPLHTRSCIG